MSGEIETSRCSGGCCRKFSIAGHDYDYLTTYMDRARKTHTSAQLKAAIQEARDEHSTIIPEIYDMLIPLGMTKYLDSENETFMYTCKHHDPVSGDCKIYDSRPFMCIKFPKSEPNGICTHPGCTRKAEKLELPDPEYVNLSEELK